MKPVLAVTFDAAETLFTLARPVGETYAVMARDFGAELNSQHLQDGFRTEFPNMPPMAFAATDAGELDRLERDWWRSLVEKVVPRVGHIAAFDDYFDAVYDYYAQAHAWRVFPEVDDLLARLNHHGVKLAVVSNFDSRLPKILTGLGIDMWFDEVVYSTVAGAAKPDKRIFELALRRLNVPAAAALHLGDNPIADAQGARDAGLQAVLVERAGPKRSRDSVISLDAIFERGLVT